MTGTIQVQSLWVKKLFRGGNKGHHDVVDDDVQHIEEPVPRGTRGGFYPSTDGKKNPSFAALLLPVKIRVFSYFQKQIVQLSLWEVPRGTGGGFHPSTDGKNPSFVRVFPSCPGVSPSQTKIFRSPLGSAQQMACAQDEGLLQYPEGLDICL